MMWLARFIYKFAMAAFIEKHPGLIFDRMINLLFVLKVKEVNCNCVIVVPCVLVADSLLVMPKMYQR